MEYLLLCSTLPTDDALDMGPLQIIFLVIGVFFFMVSSNVSEKCKASQCFNVSKFLFSKSFDKSFSRTFFNSFINKSFREKNEAHASIGYTN